MPKNNNLNRVHMNMVMEFKEQLKDHQAAYVTPEPVICKCGNEVESQPMEAGLCYDCYRASMTHRNVTITLTPAKPDSDYSGRQLPTPCPECGGLLIVRTRHMRVRGQDARLDYFVGCANFETRGCRHAEALTNQIKAAIDAIPHEEVDF